MICWRACRKPVSGLDRKPFSCPEKLFVVEGKKKKKILFDVWGEGFRGQENVTRNCLMRVSDLRPWCAGSRGGMWPCRYSLQVSSFPLVWGVYGSSCPSVQPDFLSVINGDHLGRMDSCSGLEVLSTASCSECDGKYKYKRVLSRFYITWQDKGS